MLENKTTAAPADTNEALTSYMSRFEHIKSALRSDLGDTAFRSWIQPLQFSSFDGGVLTLSVPTRFIRDWARTHYADGIAKIWSAQVAACARVEWKIEASAKPAAIVIDSGAVANENSHDAALEAVEDIFSATLDPRFTFDSFVVGPSNELAYAAARKVADEAAVSFNPLFLQGGVGRGKTHLMQAVAHAVRAQNPQRRVVYMSAEKFMYQFVRALRARDTMAFKEYFRAIDVLMIDDIQFICGKEATQQEFFHTFNALVDQGKQIILSADKAPGAFDGLDERLRSRLGMGLVAGIDAAPYALRRQILDAKCAQMKIEMPAEVLEFLAQNIASSVRELEGALNRLAAHAQLKNQPMTVENAGIILQDLLRGSCRRVSVEDIQKRVAEHFNIRLSDILSPRRARNVARPRQVAMYLSKMLTEHSLPDIGRKFAGRDHTTIIHGIRKIEELIQTDRSLADDVSTLKEMLAVA